MAETLMYASPQSDSPRWLRALSWGVIFYPVATPAAFYGQWLLSWAILGHMPLPSLDDPKDIAGANWLMAITMMLFVGFIPIGVIGLGVVVGHVCYPNAVGTRAAWLMGYLGVWTATISVLVMDPGGVMYWWMD